MINKINYMSAAPEPGVITTNTSFDVSSALDKLLGQLGIYAM